MWRWQQQTGSLTSQSGNVVGKGYSGFGAGKNNPIYQSVPDVGPCPEGFYNIEAPVDTPKHGPYVLRLEPFAENNMFGRAGFLIHGDSKTAPGTASHGCLILPRVLRELIWNSEDHQIEVSKAEAAQ
jgi:hypothetical protein